LIKEALEHTACPTHILEVEISENFLLENEEEGIAELESIRNLGIELSLDDFGTGFSSLRYLQKMPIDKVKIDKSFIADIDTNDSDLEIVTATIAMAHKLNLVVIAEGVETQSQLGLLEPEECDVVQGFLFSKPMEAREIFRLPASQDQP
jgi:EAL domain-containing protein (putative c-di-GMP-specific phosphodiesterase class I)